MGARLGQHFLHDRHVLADILQAAALQPGERVLEVGPGHGELTGPLAAAVGPTGRVVALEADMALVAGLQDRWDNVEVVPGDAVQTDLGRLGRFDALVANLPYQVSGPITAAFLRLLEDPATAWTRAVLMYQKEFAQRLAAAAGSRTYGRLSVHAARLVAVQKVRDVAPGCFAPPPQVSSQVVRLVPHAPFAVRDEALFHAVLDAAFAQRRKKLRNALAAGLPLPADHVHQALASLGWADKRAEQLSPQDFGTLADALADGVPAGVADGA